MGQERVTIERRDGRLETRTDIVVVPDRAAESRRVIVSNTSDVEAEVELTSYQEVVLATQLLDRGHRAFYNLFVQTEWLAGCGSILAMRRPRSREVKPSWGGHTVAVQSGAGPVSCETDRARFIGRGRTSRNPVAMGKPGDLSGTAGAVLDPIFALRTRLTITPGKSAQVILSTFAANDRDEAIMLAESFSDWETAVRALHEESRQDDASGPRASASEAALYQDLAGLLLYGARSAGESVSTRSDILAIGITGEWPIVLARVNSQENAGKVAELLALHRYWRSKGVAADLVILCSSEGNDRRLMDDMISMVASGDGGVLDQPAGVFVRGADFIREQDIDLLHSIARIRVDCSSSDSLRQVADG